MITVVLHRKLLYVYMYKVHCIVFVIVHVHVHVYMYMYMYVIMTCTLYTSQFIKLLYTCKYYLARKQVNIDVNY